MVGEGAICWASVHIDGSTRAENIPEKGVAGVSYYYFYI